MYQPDDLAGFEVPTARETTPMPASPGRICPDKPDRECMIRYLYAQKHNSNVKCGTCGPVSAKVASMRKAAERRKEGYKLEKQREYTRRQEAKRREERQKKISARTPEEIEARRKKMLEQLARGRETQRKTREQLGASKKKAALTATQLLEREERRLQSRRENLEKAHAALALKRSSFGVDTAVSPTREALLRSRLAMARAGVKPASRCEAVALALEWMLESGLESVAMLDFLPAVNKFMSKKIACSGVLGRSVRNYGLTVRVQYVGGGISRSTLYLDDKARDFVDSGFLRHSRIQKNPS